MSFFNNRKTIIRILSMLSLLIFFLPFFQACSDDSIKRSSGFFKVYKNVRTDSEKEIAFKKAKSDFTLSGYDLAMQFEPMLSGFTIIMIINITLFICFIRKHYEQLLLCFVNLIIITLSMVYMSFLLPGIGQIKYGMYIFLLNSILLFYLVYKEQEYPK